MRKIRTVGELEAITRFMFAAYRSRFNEILSQYEEIAEFDRISSRDKRAWRAAVESLLNHLEDVNERLLEQKNG